MYKEQADYYREKLASGWWPSHHDEGQKKWSYGLRTKCTVIDGRPVMLVYELDPGEWRQVEGMHVDGYTTQQAAAEIGVNDSRIRQLLADGAFPGAVKTGRDWWIPNAAMGICKENRSK